MQISDLDRNIEERLWALPSGEAQKAIAYRQFDKDEDILFRDDLLIYVDIMIPSIMK